MKQHLLTAGALLLVAASSFAQSRVTANTVKGLTAPVAAQDPVSNGAVHTSTPRQNRNNGVNQVNAVALTSIGSTSGNSYGGFQPFKHTFAYDPNLNLLVFAHRAGGAAGGASKELAFDISTDGGATWTPQQVVANASTTDLCRYPQACIWNPAGNTNAANAKVVTTGPATSGGGWISTYLMSANATAPATTNSGYAFSPYATDIPAAPGFLSYSSWAMSNLNGGMGYVAARMNAGDGTSATQTLTYHTIDFIKVVPNAAGTGFTRSYKFTSAPIACPLADTSSFGFNLAFGPNGNTGYISHSTVDLNGQRPEQYGRSAILYKTTDAGETWTKQAGLDLNAIQMLIDSTVGTGPGNTGPERPTISDTRLVVDNLNRCHMFAEVSSGSTTCQDSLGFTWGGATSRYVMHFIIDGGNVTGNFVYRSTNTSTTFGALTNAFDEQYQAGRSADGTRIFFAACQTPAVGATTDNNAPNLFVYAYRTTDNKVMPFKDYTTGTDAEASVFFPRLTPVVMNIAGGHRLPITLMTPGSTGGAISDTAPPDFSYLDGVDVVDADYTTAWGAIAGATHNANGTNLCGAATEACQFVGVEKGSALEGKVSFMPNPTSGNLNVNLSQLTSAATITVTDVMGRTIRTQANQIGNVSVDLTAQATGIYFVTIQNAEGKLTAKIAVAK
jgi:Secretion system C-terminal sorting domain